MIRCLRHGEDDSDYSNATRASNAFAFGTILYELLTGEWPWRDWRPAESVIWLVGPGMLPSLANIHASGTLFGRIVVRLAIWEYPAFGQDSGPLQ